MTMAHREAKSSVKATKRLLVALLVLVLAAWISGLWWCRIEDRGYQEYVQTIEEQLDHPEILDNEEGFIYVFSRNDELKQYEVDNRTWRSYGRRERTLRQPLRAYA